MSKNLVTLQIIVAIMTVVFLAYSIYEKHKALKNIDKKLSNIKNNSETSNPIV